MFQILAMISDSDVHISMKMYEDLSNTQLIPPQVLNF